MEWTQSAMSRCSIAASSLLTAISNSRSAAADTTVG
jgi:hypothetical protein